MLEYASVVWSPHLEQDKNRLESVQKKATRFIFNRYDGDFSPSSHAHLLLLPSLEHRRTPESYLVAQHCTQNNPRSLALIFR